MHIESNAFQQRFAPQPVLRSSWQQLVIFRLFFLIVIFGLDPNIQEIDVRLKAEHDGNA